MLEFEEYKVKLNNIKPTLDVLRDALKLEPAQKEIEAKYGFPVASIVSMAEVVETLYNHEIDGKVVIDDELKTAIDAYYEQYGARE